MSRFGFKNGICLLVAQVPVHCFSITQQIHLEIPEMSNSTTENLKQKKSSFEPQWSKQLKHFPMQNIRQSKGNQKCSGLPQYGSGDMWENQEEH